jgi:tRNA(fMet)-specific endonuclease VapC
VIHLDTCLLIDLLREAAKDRPGPAFDVMESLDEHEILVASVHVVAELRAGAELSRRPLKEHDALDQLLDGLHIVYPDARFAPLYGRLLAAVHRTGASIPTMDLLIATSSVLDDAPLVTRNLRDFSRVPGLRVIGY